MDIENAEGFNIMEISYIDILKRNQLKKYNMGKIEIRRRPGKSQFYSEKNVCHDYEEKMEDIEDNTQEQMKRIEGELSYQMTNLQLVEHNLGKEKSTQFNGTCNQLTDDWNKNRALFGDSAQVQIPMN